MTYRPLTHRALQWLADRLSVPPVATGVVCVSLFGFLALWISWFIGIVDDVAAGREPDIAVRAPVTLYMMLGYLPVALFYLDRWTAEHFGQICRRFSLRSDAALFPRKLLNLVGGAGAIATFTLFLGLPSSPAMLLQVDFLFPFVGLLFLGWFNFRFMFLLVWTALAISKTARRIQGIDLFDATAVRPFAQQGVRSSLLAIISLSISANLWLDPNSPLVATATTVLMLVIAALVALLLPTWGIHLRLKAEKQLELARVRKAIALRCDPTTRSVDDAQQLRADLALERRLAEVSEWPFDAGSYGRVALYVTLGLGSWVGAALVEQLLDALAR